jgi:twinkle protein
MGEYQHHEPCAKCGSSDAKAIYADGSGWCWSCQSYFPADGTENEGRSPGEEPRRVVALLPGEPIALPRRKITKETCERFRYLVNEEEGAQLATYTDETGRPVAQKVRGADKAFRWTGEPKRAQLFGFAAARGQGGRRIVITEGEIDAMSVAQVLNHKWPVVSVPNGASAAAKDLQKHLVWLEGFEQVVLMFDNDEPGQKAAAACAELFTPGKCMVASLPLKDANDMLVAGRVEELVQAIYDAKVVRPDGIRNGAELWDCVAREPEMGLSYPWPSLNQITRGMRRGEIVCWCAGTGIGKSQFIREVAYHLAQTHEQKVGMISLEESVRDTVLGQMSLVADRRLHLPEVRAEMTPEESWEYFRKSMGTGRYELYDHFGSVETNTLLPKIRYMVLACKVKWILLDHISIMVSGYAAEGDERKRIDELMTKLRQLAQELDFGLHIVSHLRRGAGEGASHEEGGRVTLADLRGSGAIGQVSNMIIAVERNPQATGEAKHRSQLRVLKNRFTGEQGPAGRLVFDLKTGRLTESQGAAVDALAVDESAATTVVCGRGEDF